MIDSIAYNGRECAAMLDFSLALLTVKGVSWLVPGIWMHTMGNWSSALNIFFFLKDVSTILAPIAYYD
jgi:hypothetical protein